MKISEITRRDIFDAIRLESVNWNGRLEEPEFMMRIFDLRSMPSTDGRYKNAEGDIWQHRMNNYDWDDYWVFSDRRFNLMHCDDEILLRFLCEMLHPVVRPEVTEAERLCQLFNTFLKNDGFALVEKTRISGKPVFVGRNVGLLPAPALASVKKVFEGVDESYVLGQISRMEAAVRNDPGLAIGTAKELVETCCKSILSERNVDFPKVVELPQLVKLTVKELELTPDDIPEKAKAVETIKRLLSNLATITSGVAELRNQYGTGHGRVPSAKGLGPRHAKLAVGAASTLAVFLLETHREKQSDS